MFDSITKDPTMIIGSVVALAGVVFLLVAEARKFRNSGMSAEEYLNEAILQGHVLWMLVIAFFIAFAEALMAASITPETVSHIANSPEALEHATRSEVPNVVARMLAHLVTNVGGFVLLIIFPQKLVDFVASFGFLTKWKNASKPVYWANVTLKAISTTALAAAAFYVPYVVYQTIASGLGELQNARWAFQELLFRDLSQVYVYYGKSPDYDPTSDFSYTMFATYGMTLVGYTLGLLDGIFAAEKRLERSVDGVAIPTGTAGQRNFTTDPRQGIKYLIGKAGSAEEKADVDQITADIYSSFMKVPIKRRAKIAATLSRLVHQWQSFDASNNKNANRRKQLLSTTRTFFRKTHKNGGLERALSSRTT